jgi:hypothetical protein
MEGATDESLYPFSNGGFFLLVGGVRHIQIGREKQRREMIGYVLYTHVEVSWDELPQLYREDAAAAACTRTGVRHCALSVQ